MAKNRNTPVNPFLLTGYVSPAYFCDRTIETGKLRSALLNGRNVTLVSPRRMGKTGLIHHLFHEVESAAEARCYYVDLYQTDSLKSLVNKLAATVLGTLDTTEEKIVKHVVSFFKMLRPVVTLDPMTGEPGFRVDVEADAAEYSLAEIFAYMEQADTRCYVAFDEFQTVASYADKNVEALLRSYIQRLTNVNFIFSGSQRHVLENMFTAVSRPFYQSTQMMPLGPIDRDAYLSFAQRLMKGHGQQLTEEAFDYAFDLLSAHTWYVHMVLNRIYESGETPITPSTVNDIVREQLLENEASYQTLLRLVTPAQGKVLAAIAKERSVREIQGKAFLSVHGLGAASSVKTAVTALLTKELLLDTPEGYQVYDRFFGLWLSRL